MRLRSCSCARSTARPAWRRSSSMRASISLKRALSSCTSRGALAGTAWRRPGESRSIWSIVRTSRPIGSSRHAQQDRVEQDGARDREREREDALGARGVLEPVARDDDGDQRRDADEERVDGEDLGEECGAGAHGTSGLAYIGTKRAAN